MRFALGAALLLTEICLAFAAGTFSVTPVRIYMNAKDRAVAVTITSNTSQISVPPGDVNFTYTSFQASTASASSSFGVRCTTALPYTMALDATSGTLLGLSYSLALSASGSGTGATQSYNINGSMAANQAGTCGTGVCTGSQTRTLTLTW